MEVSHMHKSHWIIGSMAAALLTLCGLGVAAQAPTTKSTAPAARTSPANEARAPLLWDGVPTFAKQAQPQLEARDPARRILPRPARMHVSMDILVDGQVLPTVAHAGKTYLPVPNLGAEYQIRVWNHGPRRVVAIVSVDGMSVLNGQSASEHHPGYVVAPYTNVVIKGWRRDMNKVAAFRFVERDKSYAGLIGRPENIGVIGLIAIEELSALPPAELQRKDSAAPRAKAFRGAVGSIGTEYGRELDSSIYYVPFVRSSNKQTITYYYDSVAALRAAGVPVDGPYPVPFPADPAFVPPPPGYRGK
jgi:hypothetical protein